jgi:4-alpha-glucanotransferase
MKKAHIFDQRRSGVLLHITSLPTGNLGPDAYRFVDFLHSAGVTVWQMLPLGPTHNDGSPYQCLSAHAGNHRLICQETVKSQSWVDESSLGEAKMSTLMALAHRQFMTNASDEEKSGFTDFCDSQAYWLDDYVLFRDLRNLNHSTAWFHWPEELRNRHPDALKKVIHDRSEALSIRRFEQFQFFQQWHNLKRYANEKGVKLFGDMPIFVAHDSADVWSSPELFTLDKTGQATKVAGVPPDYFSETGQRWGNPLYLWQKHIDTEFL